MDNNKKNNTLYKSLIVIAILIPMVIGFSYAYFLTNIRGNKTTISGAASSSEFTFNLITDNDGYINQTGEKSLTIIKPKFVETQAAKGMFSVSTVNTTGSQNEYPIAFNVSLTNITITNGLRDAVKNSFRWSITCETCADTSNNASGSFSGLKNLTPTGTTTTDGITTYTYDKYILSDNYKLIVCPNTTDTYTLRIWIDDLDDVEQSSVMSQSFSAKVAVDGEEAYLNNTNQCES